MSFYGPVPDPAADWLMVDQWLTGTRDEDEHLPQHHRSPTPPPTVGDARQDHRVAPVPDDKNLRLGREPRCPTSSKEQ